jgi:hypothetical protein
VQRFFAHELHELGGGATRGGPEAS